MPNICLFFNFANCYTLHLIMISKKCLFAFEKCNHILPKTNQYDHSTFNTNKSKQSPSFLLPLPQTVPAAVSPPTPSFYLSSHHSHLPPPLAPLVAPAPAHDSPLYQNNPYTSSFKPSNRYNPNLYLALF